MIRHLASNWQGSVIVCRKCSKKVGGGFGADGKTPLAKLLRKALRLKKGRKARLGVVESGCLKVCPKRAVMAVSPGGEWLVVPVAAPVEAVVGALAIDQA